MRSETLDLVVPTKEVSTATYTIENEVYSTVVTVGTSTITIPAGLPIGTRKKIMKATATAGTITIARSSTDVFTRASLTSVTLTSDGDFWVLEKVSSTRWELVDGVEIGTGTNDVVKYANGTMQQYGSYPTGTLALFNSTAGTQGWSYYYAASSSISFEETFSSTPSITVAGVSATAGSISSVTASTFTVSAIRAGSDLSVDVSWIATGRWYT